MDTEPLFPRAQRQKLTYYGHTLRAEGDTLDKDMIVGTTLGSRSIGRLRRRRIDNNEDWTELQRLTMQQKVQREASME